MGLGGLVGGGVCVKVERWEGFVWGQLCMEEAGQADDAAATALPLNPMPQGCQSRWPARDLDHTLTHKPLGPKLPLLDMLGWDGVCVGAGQVAGVCVCMCGRMCGWVGVFSLSKSYLWTQTVLETGLETSLGLICWPQKTCWLIWVVKKAIVLLYCVLNSASALKLHYKNPGKCYI